MSRAQNRFCTPPSSPPSSPTATWDSSPPSSPGLASAPLELSQRVIDPLAASYRSSPLTPQHKKARYNRILQPVAIGQRPQADDLESKIWEEASTKVFESGCRTIDLSDCQLTRIPTQFIHDLNKMVVLRGTENLPFGPSSSSLKSDVIASGRLFTRVQTAPASAFSFSRCPSSREKSISTNSILSGNSKDTIQLFLARNKLSEFPLALSRLENLTFLSLRHNFINYLPPEVARLKNLQNLNIGNNRLRFVPSELLEMKLQSLLLFPNPFITPPPSSGPRPISETEYIAHKVLPLTELALRVLLAHPTPHKSGLFSSPTDVLPETLLEQRFDLPLPIGAPWCPISPLLRQTLSACVPGSVLCDESLAMSNGDDESMQITGIGTCPNPEHGQVFVMHAEQRFTWERKIAGLDVGGAVPVRWRGCERGCLDFLCPNDDASVEEFEVVRFDGLDFD